MKVGSLFSGGGGLDLAARDLWPDCELAWVAENDRHAAALLEMRFPGVPNLGDLREVDWSQVEPVDVLVGGFPCQPWSNAGRRRGFDDERDGWPWFRDAIGVLRPRLVLLENVSGHLAGGAVRTVGDLAGLGYVGSAGTVRASDVGAPHRRERWFCAAYPGGAGAWRDGGGAPISEEPDRRGEPDDADAPGVHLGAAAYPGGERHGGGQDPRGVGRLDRRDEGEARQRQRARPESGDRSATDWGDYAAAIRRWEFVLARPAPAPTDEQGLLNPEFVEWMMGWPHGWVTEAELSRRQQIKILGNGVVPQQAVYAYSSLLARADRKVAA